MDIITRDTPYNKEWILENIEKYDVNSLITKIEYSETGNIISFFVDDAVASLTIIDELLLNMDVNFDISSQLFTSKPLRNFVLLASNGNVVQTFTNNKTVMNFSVVSRMDDLYSLASGVVTINRTGWYDINYNMNMENLSNNSRTSVVGEVERKDVNSEWESVVGSKSQGYSRNAANGDYNLNIPNAYIRLSEGTQLRVVSYRSAGGGTLRTFANGSTFNIKLGEYEN